MPKIKNISKKIIIGLTGKNDTEVIEKIRSAEKLKIKEAGLFLEMLEPNQRNNAYQELEKSKIKKIPLVHIRDDMTKKELDYLEKKYSPKYYTIHENTFTHLKKWKTYYKKLFLEMNYDNHIEKYVKVEKIGGFCIDLSHLKSAQERNTKEYEYTIKKIKETKNLCNHLNGYHNVEKRDIHTIKSEKEFDYLKKLPKLVFGDKIPL
jgi:hypothetical protein